MENETTNKRRNFDEAFKRDAVALLIKGDKPIQQLAQELGVSHWNLRDWKKRYGPPASPRSSEVLEAEVRVLLSSCPSLFSAPARFARRARRGAE